MAYFARVEDGVVTDVLAIPDSEEARGQQFLNDDLGLDGVWLQTSFNTHGGIHLSGGVPLRKNYAGIGYTYDPDRDAFIPPKPYPSWILNDESCLWEPPVAKPEGDWVWDQQNEQWVEAEL